MPHLVILYTPNVEADAELPALCRVMADAMLAQRDDQDRQVFPTGGTRVLAYPAAHYAVADGSGDHGFIYLNLRMAGGRSDAVKKRVGDALLERLKQHVAPLLAKRHVGITLQIDESPGLVYDGKCGNLHPLFQAP
ncbi:5-carboxymethyl-2-hydroxymuconate Delta-isomerase [Variovorax sp. KK3]|uniref:5-carboxymethyl-2-hydroxymuconate Delta-isomerase n=1 Tax=Variovorax sp. KK3 TaxID=1855728 RepID=UPI00097CB50F|nr:5-carboxymethyl-2-hydroxymuconate Delta-isomerase [Variovorax sp. KK3]